MPSSSMELIIYKGFGGWEAYDASLGMRTLSRASCLAGWCLSAALNVRADGSKAQLSRPPVSKIEQQGIAALLANFNWKFRSAPQGRLRLILSFGGGICGMPKWGMVIGFVLRTGWPMPALWYFVLCWLAPGWKLPSFR